MRTNWTRIGSIARFEFVAVAKRWTYLIATFGLPLFLLAVSSLVVGAQSYFLHQKASGTSVYALVDEAGLWPELEGWSGPGEDRPASLKRLAKERSLGQRALMDLTSVVFAFYDNEQQAVQAVAKGRLDGIFVIEKDFRKSARVRALRSSRAGVVSLRVSTVEPVLRNLLRRTLLRVHVSDEIAERVLEEPVFVRGEVDEAGVVASKPDNSLELVVRMMVPLLLGVLLLTALLSASGYLVQTVATDKETKIVEVLLAAASPDEVLFGKLFGLGLAGLIQFAVWSSMVVFLALLIMSTALSTMTIPWTAVAISPVFFVMGYLFFGSLMLATASLGTSAAESQKLTLGWGSLALLPLMVLVILLDEPHGALGQMMTWIPFTTPLTVIVRLAVDPTGISWWEIGASLFVLFVATWLTIRIGARLFRVGFLLTDSRPSLRELWKQAQLLD